MGCNSAQEIHLLQHKYHNKELINASAYQHKYATVAKSATNPNHPDTNPNSTDPIFPHFCINNPQLLWTQTRSEYITNDAKF